MVSQTGREAALNSTGGGPPGTPGALRGSGKLRTWWGQERVGCTGEEAKSLFELD